MRFGRWLAAGMALVLVVTFSFAQQGRRGPGMGGGGSSLFLLSQKSVQDELKLTEEQVKKVTALEEKQRESFKGFKDLSKEERKTKAEERAKETKKAVDEILKPEQVKRLKQISIQQSGSRAYSDPEVEEALKLSAEQKEKIKGIQEDSFKEMRDLFGGGGDREEARKKMESIRKASEEKIQGVLSAEQKTKFKELAGEPFKGEIKRPEFRGKGNKKKSEIQ
jgi:Spy/CpxP family protein refolding chaperone